MTSVAELRSRQQISSLEEKQETLSNNINASEEESNEVTSKTNEEDDHDDINSHTNESAETMLDLRELVTFRVYQAHAEEFVAY